MENMIKGNLIIGYESGEIFTHVCITELLQYLMTSRAGMIIMCGPRRMCTLCNDLPPWGV